jgi:hypothetical protein
MLHQLTNVAMEANTIKGVINGLIFYNTRDTFGNLLIKRVHAE